MFSDIFSCCVNCCVLLHRSFQVPVRQNLIIVIVTMVIIMIIMLGKPHVRKMHLPLIMIFMITMNVMITMIVIIS